MSSMQRSIRRNILKTLIKKSNEMNKLDKKGKRNAKRKILSTKH